MNRADDTGWRPALRPIWMFLVPWIALFVFKRRLDLSGIRRVFLHLSITRVVVAIVISSIFVGPPRDATWAWVLLGVGTVGCVGGLVWSSKSHWRGPPDPADLSSAESVANSFRALSFIRLGLAASPTLYGIVGTELTGAAEVSLVGPGVSVLLIAVHGPTRTRCDEIQERLRVAGSSISLREALDQTAS